MISDATMSFGRLENSEINAWSHSWRQKYLNSSIANTCSMSYLSLQNLVSTQFCSVNSISAVTKAVKFLLHSFIWILIKCFVLHKRESPLKKQFLRNILTKPIFFEKSLLLRKSKNWYHSDEQETSSSPTALVISSCSIRICFYFSSESFVGKRSKNS